MCLRRVSHSCSFGHGGHKPIDTGVHLIFFYVSLIHQLAPHTWEAIQATIENVNAERYSRMPLPLPAIGEQQAIISFLDRQTGRIDALSARVEAAIERLQEYRTALITAAVTGKIDVREHDAGRDGSQQDMTSQTSEKAFEATVESMLVAGGWQKGDTVPSGMWSERCSLLVWLRSSRPLSPSCGTSWPLSMVGIWRRWLLTSW